MSQRHSQKTAGQPASTSHTHTLSKQSLNTDTHMPTHPLVSQYKPRVGQDVPPALYGLQITVPMVPVVEVFGTRRFGVCQHPIIGQWGTSSLPPSCLYDQPWELSV